MFGFLKELFGIKSEAEKKLDERARKFEEMMDRKIESGEWVHRETQHRVPTIPVRKHPRYSEPEPNCASGYSEGDSND